MKVFPIVICLAIGCGMVLNLGFMLRRVPDLTSKQTYTDEYAKLDMDIKQVSRRRAGLVS